VVPRSGRGEIGIEWRQRVGPSREACLAIVPQNEVRQEFLRHHDIEVAVAIEIGRLHVHAVLGDGTARGQVGFCDVHEAQNGDFALEMRPAWSERRESEGERDHGARDGIAHRLRAR